MPKLMLALIGVTLVGHGEFSCADRIADGFNMREHLFGGRFRDHDGKLFPAEAAHPIILSGMLFEDIRNANQYLVAGQMTIGVIDIAQQVQVAHDHREGPFKTVGPLQLGL